MSILSGWFYAEYNLPPESALVLTYDSSKPNIRLGYYQTGKWWSCWHERMGVTGWTWPVNSQNGRFLKIQEHSLARKILNTIINMEKWKLL